MPILVCGAGDRPALHDGRERSPSGPGRADDRVNRRLASVTRRGSLSVMITRAKLLAGAGVVLACVLTVPIALHAWGDVGHTITGAAAAAKLPNDMPAFFRNASRQLTYLNPEPDRWREHTESQIDHALDGGASQDHFIDMELAPPAVTAAALAAPTRYAYLDTLARAGVNGVSMCLLPF